MRDCRQISEQSPYCALSFWLFFTLMLLSVGAMEGRVWARKSKKSENPTCGQSQKLNKMSFSSSLQVDTKIWFAIGK